MAIVYTWNVSQTNYETANGFITTAHWQCSAVDGEYQTSTYSTCGWSAGEPTIEYADVTMAEVLDWIWASGVDKEATEASLAAQIDLLKNPVSASGVPWSTQAE
jgi:hypothetical protein